MILNLKKNIFDGKIIKRDFHSHKVFTETNRDFLKCYDFYNLLKDNDIDFYTGVPDSLLKDYLLYIKDKNNFITANEGLSVSFCYWISFSY